MNYRFREERPTPAEYVALREAAGMKPRTVAAGRRGLPNTLYSVTARVGNEADGDGFDGVDAGSVGDEERPAGGETGLAGGETGLAGNTESLAGGTERLAGGTESITGDSTESFTGDGTDGTGAETGVVGDDLVGMGRVIGDDGCFYQLVGVAVHPDHQRQGLGARVVSSLLEYVEETAPPSAYVSLISDVDGFYEQFGIRDAGPESEGMFLRVGDLR